MKIIWKYLILFDTRNCGKYQNRGRIFVNRGENLK